MNQLKQVAHMIATRIIDFVEKEPVRAATLSVSVVVIVAGQLGFVLDEQSILSTVLTVVAILGGGEWARRKVTPGSWVSTSE